MGKGVWGGGVRPPNLVILEFGRANSKCSSGKNYAIEPKILHHLSKGNSCRENFDKFTKKLLKNLCFGANYRNVVRKNLEKRHGKQLNVLVRKNIFFDCSSGTPYLLGKTSLHPSNRSTEVSALYISQIYVHTFI